MLQKNCLGFYKRLVNVHRYLIISGTAKWHIDDQIFDAEAGKLIHHPPGAGHRFVTSDLPYWPFG